MQKFVHLHVHTQYSLLDGATRISKLFKKCGELGMPAVAITDHGNMYGAMEFFKAAVKYTDPKADPFDFIKEGREFKIKPIIGCELYTTTDMTVKNSVGGKMPKLNHLILLAKNIKGYKNLIKLVSQGYIEGMYYKPRIDFNLLKEHAEGLICLSACLAGELPQALLKGEDGEAQKIVEKFKALFGEDYYIEIQDHSIRDQRIVLPKLVEIARANNVKLVATNDVHYLEKKDSLMQKVLQCIAFRSTLGGGEEDFDESQLSDKPVEEDAYFPTREFYLKSGDEMSELFPNLQDAIENTLEIADKCCCNFFSKQPLMPAYIPEDGSTPYEFLRKLAEDGLKKKYGEITPEIRERAEYELGIVNRLGFVEYYLIVWDFINWSETHGVPVGPGRGSGVGSIIAYSIGITKVDPIKYNLLFERFLNAERVSNPDFDIDFCVEGREKTINYVISKYGKDNVAQIVTFGTLAAKAAVKDVGRVFNHPFAEVNKITKLMPTMMGKNHIGHLLGLEPPLKDGENPVVPELKEMYETDQNVKRIMDMAMQVEGMPRQTGMHAAGVIICRDPISMHVPMSRSTEGIVTTEYNMIECEELGLLKMDFLGLRTVTDIQKAINIVKKTRGIDLDFYNGMDYGDQGVFKLIGDGDTHAVFQLESEGMKKFMRELKPTSLEDIIAGISLYRPGPLDKIPLYVRNKNHPDMVTYDHPLLEPILSVTYGVMVYQEQVMSIVQKLGGYSLGRADIVRRMMSKKKHEAMEKEREIFLHGTVDNKGTVVPGCIKNGVPEKVANKVYDDMISFASYAFNKSHAAAYAYLAYQTAYLKCYYTVEFVTAVLNNRITSIDEITNYLSYLKERGYTVLPPNINKSYADFSVEDGCVRIGMAAIKNVGSAIIDEIVNEREANGEFTDFVQFVSRMVDTGVTLNKKQLESLIYAGTFDCFNLHRSQLISVYEQILDRAAKDRQAKMKGQFSFFDMPGADKITVSSFDYPDIREYPLSEKLAKEKEVSGVYLTGHPLDEYREALAKMDYNTSMFKVSGEDDEVREEVFVPEDSTVTVAGILIEATRKNSKKTGKDFGIGKLEDLYGSIELMLGGFLLTKYRDLFVKDKLVLITGKIRYRDEGASISVDRMEEWKAKVSAVRKICCYVSFTECEEKLVDELQDIFSAYPGYDEAFIKNRDDGKIYPLGMKTKINEYMLKELYGLLGENNIKIV